MPDSLRHLEPSMNLADPLLTRESPWGLGWLQPLFPPQASTVAGEVDAMYVFAVVVSVIVSLAISGLIVYFSWKYYYTRKADRSNARTSHLGMEISWIFLPLVFSVIIFIWAAKVYLEVYTPPRDVQDVYVVGKQWMWKIQHPEGPREIDRLHVPVGRAIRLIMTSQDVIHSFYIPAFRIKRDVLPGRYTTAWFRATKPGRYHLFCAEYCGTRHSRMIGYVEVMEPVAYQQWIASGGQTDGGEGDAGGRGGEMLTLAEQGEQLFATLGCSSCHSPRSLVPAPMLEGVFGRPRPLQGGGFAVADESYLRESIYFPNRKIVEGYQPVMPSFQGIVSEEEMVSLVEYIRSLGEEEARTADGAGGAAPSAPNAEARENP